MTGEAPVLSIRTRTERGALVAELSGRLSAGPGVETFKGELFPVIESGANLVVIDMSGVPYADSMGIEALVSVYQKTQELGGGMRVLNPSPKVVQLFDLTKLGEVLGIVDNESGAIDSLLEGP
jgi:stage II sporulation protein AA (anti-sigma F factor antagonist)